MKVAPPQRADQRSFVEQLIDDGEWEAFVDGLTDEEYRHVARRWDLWRRPSQCPPPTIGSEHTVWSVRAGRGFGKTRIGAETVREVVTWAPLIAVVAPTASDVRDIMVEGESGILSVFPRWERPQYEPSKRRITFANGARAVTFSADEPERLRGPQFYWGWFDEPASMRRGLEAWQNFEFGLRLGLHPWALVTGTPKPLAWLRELMADPATITTTGSTYENVGNLSDVFLRRVLGRYEGTRLGRQELHAEFLDDVEGALWTMPTIDATRVMRFNRDDPWHSLNVELSKAREALGLGPTPALLDRRQWRYLLAVDPPGETAECGIIVGCAPARGRAGSDHAVIVDDCTTAGPPEHWAAAVVAAAHRWNVERIVVEANQGGDMVRSSIHNVDPNLTVEKVRAKDSKYDRAEPVSVLYSRGWVHHQGFFPQLEEQLSTWVPTEAKSPDRLDALVHLVTALLQPVPLGRSTVSSPVRRRVG